MKKSNQIVSFGVGWFQFLYLNEFLFFVVEFFSPLFVKHIHQHSSIIMLHNNLTIYERTHHSYYSSVLECNFGLNIL